VERLATTHSARTPPVRCPYGGGNVNESREATTFVTPAIAETLGLAGSTPLDLLKRLASCGPIFDRAPTLGSRAAVGRDWLVGTCQARRPMTGYRRPRYTIRLAAVSAVDDVHTAAHARMRARECVVRWRTTRLWRRGCFVASTRCRPILKRVTIRVSSDTAG
jgi:hypothetical protein